MATASRWACSTASSAPSALVAGSARCWPWLGDGAFLTDGEVIAVLAARRRRAAALWAVLGAAFGSVVPNQVAAIVVILAFTQLVEPIARLALGAFDLTDGVAKFLPGAAADALIGASLFGEMGAGETAVAACGRRGDARLRRRLRTAGAAHHAAARHRVTAAGSRIRRQRGSV